MLGNTLTPAVPFVGLVVTAFDEGAQRIDDVFGPPTGAIQGKHAVGGAPPGSTGINLSLFLRALGKIFSWRFGGKVWPHPFFARDSGAPIYPVDVLSHDEREALRAYCGPHPTMHA